MVYVYVDSAAISIARIDGRVRKGGHHIPDQDVHRRVRRSLRSFWRIYRPRAGRWELVYDGENGFTRVAAGDRHGDSVRQAWRFEDFRRQMEGTP